MIDPDALYHCFGLVLAKMFSLRFQELERQKHTCTVLQHKQEELKEGIHQRDELIEVKKKKKERKLKHTLTPKHIGFVVG